MTIKDSHHPYKRDSHDADAIDQIRTDPSIHFKRIKKIIMGIDALSHTHDLYNEILHELYCYGLCQYNKSHKAYIYEQSNNAPTNSCF